MLFSNSSNQIFKAILFQIHVIYCKSLQCILAAATIIMKLSILLKDLTLHPIQHDRDIAGLSLDSRTTKSGDLFIACQHGEVDGREFIQDAIKKGAASVLVEAEGDNAEILLRNSVSIVPVLNLKAKINAIAARFYQSPAESMQLIGITGASGKNSCSHFIAYALHQLSLSCGVIGREGCGIYGKVEPNSVSTCDTIAIQKYLADFLKKGTKKAALALSPDQVMQGDVDNLQLAVGVFTNATSASSEAEKAATLALLARSQFAVVNLDDEFSEEILSSSGDTKKFFAYSINELSQQKKMPAGVVRIYAENIRLDMSGIHAHIVSPWGTGELQTHVIGRFNLSNLLATLATLCLLEVPFEKALMSLSHMKPAPGRMHMLGGRTQPLVIVDSARTPEALEKILFALREHCHRKLFCVLSCDGDRDQDKRPFMAEIAEMYADEVILTSANPYHEDPLEIIASVQQGFLEPENIKTELDRAKAIHDVIKHAVVGDCILVAGRGAEAYQTIGDEKVPLCDIEIINETLTHANHA
jgi:UDP-N-acetylmuramoyl-L-alanyl-D-glutamate--2,6-diaminopimelate ligase